MSEVFSEDIKYFQGTNSKSIYLKKLADRFGISDFAYMKVNAHSADENSQLLITTYSEQWEKRYAQKRYETKDPVVRNSFLGVLPFDWGDVAVSSASARNFFGEAAEFGVSPQGVSIPIRAPNGARALFSISSRESSIEWQRMKKYLISDFTYLGFLIHTAVSKFNAENDNSVKLSPREQEVLHWASKGKSCWETGKILNISERTVNFYTQNASAKLGATTKTQAVAMAIQRKLLNF